MVTAGSVGINQAEEPETSPGTDYYMGNYTITFYCPCKKCCGKSPGDPGYKITASGTTATEGRTIGVNPKVIPYGTEVYIDGLGWYTAEDTGGAIKGNKIDVYMESHQECLQMGKQYRDVYVRR